MIIDRQYLADLRAALWADILFNQDEPAIPEGPGDRVSVLSRPLTPAELFLINTEFLGANLSPEEILTGAAQVAEATAGGRAYTPAEDMLVEDADLLREGEP